MKPFGRIKPSVRDLVIAGQRRADEAIRAIVAKMATAEKTTQFESVQKGEH